MRYRRRESTSRIAVNLVERGKLVSLLLNSVQWAQVPVAVGLGWAHGEFLGEGESLISSQMRLRAQCTDSYSLRLALNHNYDFSWHVAKFFSPMLAVP